MFNTILHVLKGGPLFHIKLIEPQDLKPFSSKGNKSELEIRHGPRGQGGKSLTRRKLGIRGEGMMVGAIEVMIICRRKWT